MGSDYQEMNIFVRRATEEARHNRVGLAERIGDFTTMTIERGAQLIGRVREIASVALQPTVEQPVDPRDQAA